MTSMGSSSKCCTTTCVKNTLNIFNLIFLFTGVGVLLVAIWTILDKYDYVSLLTSMTYPVIVNCLLAAGVSLIVIFFMGCYAVLKEKKIVLIIYVFLLLLIILIELMVGLLGFIYEDNIKSELKMNLNNTMIDNYGIDDTKTQAIDALQFKFDCCGAESFEDWQFSRWIIDPQSFHNVVPDSCCRSISFHCGERDHPSNIHDIGCLEKMEHHLRSHVLILSAVGAGIGLSQIVGLILAIRLYFKLKYEHDANNSEMRRFLKDQNNITNV